jgi:hypothetical protein
MTFKETLKQAAAEVDTWPQWKREALGVFNELRAWALALRFWEQCDADRRDRRRRDCAADTDNGEANK